MPRPAPPRPAPPRPVRPAVRPVRPAVRSMYVSCDDNNDDDDVALTFFRALKTFRLTFLRMRNKCNITNVQRNNKAFSV